MKHFSVWNRVKGWKHRYWFIYKTLQSQKEKEGEREREMEPERVREKATRATDTQHYFTKPIIHRAIAQNDIVHFKKKCTHTHTHKYACLHICTRMHTHKHADTHAAQPHISVWFVLILWVQWVALNLLTETHAHADFTALRQLPVLLGTNKDGARGRGERD